MTTSGEKILDKLDNESAQHSLANSEETQYHHLSFFTSKFGRSCLTLTPHFDVGAQQTTCTDNASMLFSEEMWTQNGRRGGEPSSSS